MIVSSVYHVTRILASLKDLDSTVGSFFSCFWRLKPRKSNSLSLPLKLTLVSQVVGL